MSSVFYWTLGLGLFGALLVLGGPVVMVWAFRHTFRNPFQWKGLAIVSGAMMLLVGMIFPTMAIVIMDEQNPGESVVAHVLYTQEERAQLQVEAVLRRKLRPITQAFTLLCPHPKLYTTPHYEELQEWRAYYSARLDPVPELRDCFAHPRSFTSRVERPIAKHL